MTTLRDWHALGAGPFVLRLAGVGAVAGFTAWALLFLAHLWFDVDRPSAAVLFWAILRGALFGAILALILRALRRAGVSGLQAAVLFLDLVATPLLVFILAGLWLFRDQVFVIGSPLTLATLLMLIGFVAILVFDVVSVVWLGRLSLDRERDRASPWLLALGVLCLVFLAGQKVMVDEVAHETVGGWTLQTEYLMLYGMLAVQLAYNLLVGWRLAGRSWPRRTALVR